MPRSASGNASSRSALVRLLAVAAVAFPAAGSAAIMVYTNEGDFNASLGATPTYQENFALMPVGTNPTTSTFTSSNPAVSFTAAAEGVDGVHLYRNELATPYGSWISTDAAGSSMTFTFNNGGVSAIGGNFFLTNLNEAYLPGTFNISVNGAPAIVVTSLASGDQPFRGFQATGGDAIVTLTVTSGTIPPNAPENYYPTATNFTMAAIPETGSAFLGLLGTALLLKRRRK